jgi:hypothetical protein
MMGKLTYIELRVKLRTDWKLGILDTVQRMTSTRETLRKSHSGSSLPGVAEFRPSRVFLLSPANLAGRRGSMILSSTARFELALRLQAEGLPLGDLFSFISGLYFRGKLAYARAFANVPAGVPGVFVITSCLGLVSPERLMRVEHLKEMTSVPIDPCDPRYRAPLERDARRVAELAGAGGEIVLLGSIATPKYVEPLQTVLGERLVFPTEFVGRGDMSRGGLMLRCVRAASQLSYVPVATAVRRGSRPPKLPGLKTVRTAD